MALNYQPNAVHVDVHELRSRAMPTTLRCCAMAASAGRMSVIGFPDPVALVSQCRAERQSVSAGPSLINHELNLAHRLHSEMLGYHLSRLAFRSEAFRLAPSNERPTGTTVFTLDINRDLR
jgi:hypothetical protein